jgi:hypothetical protein
MTLAFHDYVTRDQASYLRELGRKLAADKARAHEARVERVTKMAAQLLLTSQQSKEGGSKKLSME